MLVNKGEIMERDKDLMTLVSMGYGELTETSPMVHIELYRPLVIWQRVANDIVQEGETGWQHKFVSIFDSVSQPQSLLALRAHKAMELLNTTKDLDIRNNTEILCVYSLCQTLYERKNNIPISANTKGLLVEYDEYRDADIAIGHKLQREGIKEAYPELLEAISKDESYAHRFNDIKIQGDRLNKGLKDEYMHDWVTDGIICRSVLEYNKEKNELSFVIGKKIIKTIPVPAGYIAGALPRDSVVTFKKESEPIFEMATKDDVLTNVFKISTAEIIEKGVQIKEIIETAHKEFSKEIKKLQPKRATIVQLKNLKDIYSAEKIEEHQQDKLLASLLALNKMRLVYQIKRDLESEQILEELLTADFGDKAEMIKGIERAQSHFSSKVSIDAK